MSAAARWLPAIPILEWGRQYNRETLTNDLVAALIVTIMLIPQSLAYALLAGLPAEVGLYASMAPLFLYAFEHGRSTIISHTRNHFFLFTTSGVTASTVLTTVLTAYTAAEPAASATARTVHP
jgi:MFS superfamily sulfate permease-like transporter